eukprot:Gb_17020 [translate_table: standard]
MRGVHEVAVKRLPGTARGSFHDHGFSAEIQTLGKICHRYIVRLLGFCSGNETNPLVYMNTPPMETWKSYFMSNNILLDSQFEAHVADFGLAKFLQDSGASDCVSSIAGRYRYIAPGGQWVNLGMGLIFSNGQEKLTTSVKEGVLNVLDSRLSTVPLHEGMHVFYVAMLYVEEHSVERPTMREVGQLLTGLPKIKKIEYSSSAKGDKETVIQPPDLLSI